MKKILFTALLLISADMVNAQLQVDSLGNTFMGNRYVPETIRNTTKTTISSIDACTNTLYLQSEGCTSANNSENRVALNALSKGYKSKYVYGVKSIVYSYPSSPTSRTGYRFGVVGLASGGLDGQNFGLYGASPINNGAGVYGTTTGSISHISMPTLDGQYAGYFNGLTKVHGNLVVSGNISGTLLSRTAESSPRSINSLSNYVLSSQLHGLTANTFYIDSPEPIKTLAVSASEEEDADTKEEVDTEPMGKMEKQIYSKQHYSLSADELEAIFPDLVYENEDGTKSINYVEMVPILVQAIGELSAKVAALEGKDGSVKKVAAKTTGINDVDGSVDVLALGQNKPNPFGTSTEIEVSVPESVQSAFVYVYDLQGKKVQQVNLTARGKQTVQLNAADLTDGMYLYSLIADGKVVETRRMIVEK